MAITAPSILGYDSLPPRLRRFLIAVSLLGPAIAVAFAVGGEAERTRRQVLFAGLLTILVALAERYSLHLTHHTYVSVNTAVYVAMLLMVPWSAVGVLALVSVAVAEGLRRRTPGGPIDLPENFFNIGQVALYVSAGAAYYALIADRWPEPQIDGLGSAIGIAGGATVMHLVNTGLVAVPSALQVGSSPFRVWRQTFPLDLVAHVVLSVVGVMAAVIVVDQPLVLPVVLLPGFLMQRAVKESVHLRTETHQALASLVEIVELRDPYTAGHSRRVAETARAIAEWMGLTAEEADLIESAGRVHDLGKVAIDPLVVMKTTKLDADEWAQMKLHPVYSAEVVARFAAYREGTALVRHHHERWDGQGYPDGLAGEAIPLGARILAVADTFDALTSDRPYRRGMETGRATAILREGAGTQWDARVVEAMLAVLAATPERVPLYQAPTETPASSAPAAPAAQHVPARVQAA
ncbi:MAG TPA: HD-GYP domain-containing protein [Thermomicrobiales bacterium]|nr:HD-GYP domain-containing protein [Thermomicrobiales bacterium]